ncbi:MAG: PBP1A family penicillin-binding protein [Candidatus Aminicenantes bacterium]|nr:PBP1A family penicillin-binding protein [Candidatus Aminicenantes bacterium]
MTEEKDPKREKKLILRIPKVDLKKVNLKKVFNKKTYKWLLVAAAVLFVIGLGVSIGVYRAIMQNLPDISTLEEMKPSIITYLYADDGEIMGEYAFQKRIEVPYEDIPEHMKDAIIATEDPRFYRHNGIDFLGILRAMKEDLRLIFTPQRLQGGSTLSQQLVRGLLLHRKQLIRRKIKEWILALQLERNYSKQEILTMYCNQFNLGHGAYGVEAAAQLYFDKTVSELDLAESAMITGIFRSPFNYSPYRNYDLTLRRRNHVLNRMVEEKYIPPEQAEEVKEKGLDVLPLHREDSEFAAYFREEVRRYLYKNYGAEALYHGGLRIYTTMDMKLQEYAEKSLRAQLRVMDKRQGWRDDKGNCLDLFPDAEDLQELEGPFKDEESGNTYLMDWRKPEIKPNEVVDALVLNVSTREAEVKVKGYSGTLSNRDIDWTGTKNLQRLIKEGDIIHVMIHSIEDEDKSFQASLEQEPKLEGAFLVIEPQTGQVKAMVGGYSYQRSEWNNATQAMRQSGSVIKPILYTAGLENGLTPASTFIDEPMKFEDKWSGKIWDPPNYDEKYKGRVTLRKGLEESRNIVTAKLLDHISPQEGVKYCKKFGLTSNILPYLSLALGAFEVKMIELVSAFTVFPNQGVRIEPYFIKRIEDRQGNILEQAKVEAHHVISPQIAYIMTSLLQGGVKRGTGWRASSLEMPLAGKTGTTDDWSDAWFMGFSPDLCAGVWVGYREGRISLGQRQSGAVAAQPAWVDFFSRIIEQKKKEVEEQDMEYEQGEFLMPPNLSFVNIDYKTGLLPTPVCAPQFIIREVFLPGTEPNRFCSYEDHMMTYDYYEVAEDK